jgi:hypothetical protein
MFFFLSFLFFFMMTESVKMACEYNPFPLFHPLKYYFVVEKHASFFNNLDLNLRDLLNSS